MLTPALSAVSAACNLSRRMALIRQSGPSGEIASGRVHNSPKMYDAL